MAYDGIITGAIARELERLIVPGKIEKVYQPGSEELILQVHSPAGKHRLLLACGSETARVCLTTERYRNPDEPPAFCMLLRKHIQSGHITAVRQNGSERIIEIDIDTLSELGFDVRKRLIIEIMGKHSNIVLLDVESGKIIDSIKRISIDVNRYRQLLPGVIYKYPPQQEKLPFREVTCSEDILRGLQVGAATRAEMLADPKYLMSRIAGISPAIARELASTGRAGEALHELVGMVDRGEYAARVYCDGDTPREFHITDLSEYSELEEMRFGTVSECVEFFYQNRARTNTIKMRSVPLIKHIRQHLDKALLKKKRIGEDILSAEDSEKYRLYGELLTANIHLVRPGARSVTVTNYYDGQLIDIPLDEKLSAAKNAQHYFKKYAKAKTALKEKAVQLEDTENDIRYLESVLQNAEAAVTEEDLDEIRDELIETGFMRNRTKKNERRKKRSKPEPIRYTASDGSSVLVGRNNAGNDYVTTRLADRGDLWFHTKDIPGSHVILRMERRTVEDLPDSLIYEVAGIAAYHSKGKESENVPVDLTYIKYVKKPAGAKPGMVIFTHNTTVYVNPSIPPQERN